MIPNRIVVLGGSSVYGQGDPDGGGFVGRFRRLHKPRHPSNRVFNLGVDGDTVTKMLARMHAEVSARRIDLLLLYPGFNDICFKKSEDSAGESILAAYRESLSSLIDNAKSLCPTVLMSSFPLDEQQTRPWDGRFYFSSSDAQQLNEIGAELSRVHRVQHFDLWNRCNSLGAWSNYTTDGRHASSKGHNFAAEESDKFLNNEIGNA